MNHRSIPLADISVTQAEISRVESAVREGQVSGTGRDVAEFQEMLGDIVNRNFVIATNSGTMALVVLLQALGIGSGDKVLVSSFTFVAPAAACRLVGATPVLVDINKESWTIDPIQAQYAIHLHGKENVKALIAVDIIGHPAAYDLLYKLCRDNNIFLIEDAAQAHGSQYHSQDPGILQSHCGSFGHGSIFSFHANKTISCGEGGAILVDDFALAQECQVIANHGMKPGTGYTHTRIGRNGRLGNLQAAFGCGQLTRWEELTTSRIRTVDSYCRHLSGLPGLLPRPQTRLYDAEIVPWMMTLFVDSAQAGMNAIQLVQRLKYRSIDARASWPPLHYPPTGAFYGGGNLSVCEAISNNVIFLPTHQMMGEDDIKYICQNIEEILDGEEAKTS